MGSEHYCLRWNNHQSNLLGVFSQLLQDESLVDVTLACSEGASIRAHKVVLSACSSYFQSLFLDHPSRHPIVILKDVRFSELQTLVEFMYKGEVNVQYCQLSALLKTAESLKVKGLAEMTNQNSALREPEREPDRLRPHSQPKPSSCDTPMDVSGRSTPTPTPQSNNSTIAPNSTSSSLKRENDTCSPSSPPKRLQTSPTPLDLYQRKCQSRSNRDRGGDRGGDRNHHDPSTILDDRTPSPCDRPNSAEDDPMSNDIGLNMTMNPGLVTGNNGGSGISGSSVQSIQQSVVVPPVNSSSSASDLIRPSSRGGGGGVGGGGGGVGQGLSSTVTHTSTSSGLSSPIISSEPVAGPSGLGPVQSVPLSLKKEVDWDRSDDKSTSDTIEYRHSHDSETSESPHGLGGGGGGGGGSVGSGCNTTGGPSPLDQGGPMYPCMYCGATFPHQSKLTRHILSHSLETLKFRETAHLLHPSHIANLLPHELPSLPQHFSHRQLPPPLEPLEPPDSGTLDIKYAAAAAAAAAAAVSSANVVGGNSTGNLTGSIIGDASSNLGCSSNDPNSVVLCKFCGKSFPDVASLITHLPVHTGDRPFKCEFCGKAFKLRHHMKDHCRVHTGERPFRCSMCGKTFSRSTILKAHEKTHFPKYVRKYLSPIDTKDELPQ